MIRVWPWSKRTKALASVDPPYDERSLLPDTSSVHPRRRLARDYVYPDYVDSEALTALAQAKGVTLDPVVLGLSQTASTGSSHTTETLAALRTPVSEVGTRASKSVSEETTIGRSIAIQKRQTMRWVVDELTDVLRAEGALREDLAFVPDECENEFALVTAARQAVLDWGLSEIAWTVKGETSTGSSNDDVAAGATWNSHRPTPGQLALALETVTYASGDVVREAMLRSTELALTSEGKTLFALVTVPWGYQQLSEHSGELWSGGLVRRTEPDLLSMGPSPAVIQIPIDPTKLNPLARGRYVTSGPFQPLQAFAKIERVERHAGRWIILTPIVILSA